MTPPRQIWLVWFLIRPPNCALHISVRVRQWSHKTTAARDPGLLFPPDFFFFFFFYCSLLTSPALATITIQYMHCFIKIKNCTGQFRYIIFQIFFCCYSLNILINRRCKKVSAWWWFLPPTQCFLQTVNYSAALCFCFWQIFQGFFFCFVLVTCLKDWTFFFCFVLF